MATKKRTTKRKGASKSAKSAEMKSFRVAREPYPFTTPRLTRQTAYWVVLVMVIVFLQLWIIKQQIELARITENVSQSMQR